MITIRKFVSLQKAELVAAALRDRGIPAMINHTHLNSMLPIGEISLNIPESAELEARQIIEEMEFNELQEVEEDFREADIDDIIYQKELNSRGKGRINLAVLVVLILIICLLLYITFTNNTSFLPY